MKSPAARVVVNGIVGTCGQRKVFLGFAPANLLYSLSFADVLDESTKIGYQRKFSRKHSVDFRRYIRLQNSSTIPLTFNLRPENESLWRIKENSTGASLVIEAGTNRIFSQVDCQHRLGCLADLDVSLAFMSFIGLTLKEEMQIFSVINSKAKGLNASLLDFHESRLLENLSKVRPALYIALRLNENTESPWLGQLDLGGDNTVGMTRRASLRTMQNAAKRFLAASHILESSSAEDAARVVCDFWWAVSVLLESAWQQPRKHFLTKGIGVYALMKLAAELWKEARFAKQYCNREYFLGVLSDFLPQFDWSHNGPFKGLGGEAGADEAFEVLNQQRLATATIANDHGE
jgi:DGQHR domain-containing protein